MSWFIFNLDETIDNTIDVANESLKTVVHESFSLSEQVTNGIASSVLRVVDKDAYDEYLDNTKRYIITSDAESKRQTGSGGLHHVTTGSRMPTSSGHSTKPKGKRRNRSGDDEDDDEEEEEEGSGVGVEKQTSKRKGKETSEASNIVLTNEGLPIKPKKKSSEGRKRYPVKPAIVAKRPSPSSTAKDGGWFESLNLNLDLDIPSDLLSETDDRFELMPEVFDDHTEEYSVKSARSTGVSSALVPHRAFNKKESGDGSWMGGSVMEFLMTFWTSGYAETKEKMSQMAYDSVFNVMSLIDHHDHTGTGLLEDLEIATILGIDQATESFRSIFQATLSNIHEMDRESFLDVTRYPRVTQKMVTRALVYMQAVNKYSNWMRKVLKDPTQLLAANQLDTRTIKEIVLAAGYPYEAYEVTTEDGYILTLERIPRPESVNTVYFQHGVTDTSFAWVANGTTSSAAFQAFEAGCDIWMGSLRGTGHRKHVKEDISDAKYWDFNVNHHAEYDIPCFIRAIKKIKTRELQLETVIAELGTQNASEQDDVISHHDRAQRAKEGEKEADFDLTIVAHSMGAAATIMYLITCSKDTQAHNVSQAILLSPAGIHEKWPLFCKVAGPILNTLYTPFFNSFRFPSDFARMLTAKIMYDVQNLPAAKSLAMIMAHSLLGGAQSDAKSPVTKVHNLAYNSLAGTSVGIFKHFWQIAWDHNGEFRGYDYGRERNLKVYGQPNPPVYTDMYDKITVPVHFVMGLQDRLIDPYNVLKHFHTLSAAHPELAHLKSFPEFGHMDFTLSVQKDSLMQYILRHVSTPGQRFRFKKRVFRLPSSATSSSSSSSSLKKSNVIFDFDDNETDLNDE